MVRERQEIDYKQLPVFLQTCLLFSSPDLPKMLLDDIPSTGRMTLLSRRSGEYKPQGGGFQHRKGDRAKDSGTILRPQHGGGRGGVGVEGAKKKVRCCQAHVSRWGMGSSFRVRGNGNPESGTKSADLRYGDTWYNAS